MLLLVYNFCANYDDLQWFSNVHRTFYHPDLIVLSFLVSDQERVLIGSEEGLSIVELQKDSKYYSL